MAPHRTQARAQRGFTLIEMAIAVAIFGTLASGAILATSAWLGKQALDKTHRNLDRIESALTLYVVQNGRLPCPYLGAAGTYASNCSGGTHYVGMVPYRDLGLQRTDVIDGWNRYYTYAVDDVWADVPTGNKTPFQLDGNLRSLEQLKDRNDPATDGADAALVVTDDAAAGCLVGAATSAPSCAAYALVSHGEEGNGAYTDFPGTRRPNSPETSVAEDENNNDDATFAAEPRAGDNQFDHIVRFRTPAQILRDAW